MQPNMSANDPKRTLGDGKSDALSQKLIQLRIGRIADKRCGQ
jgi:hypothetical protein